MRSRGLLLQKTQAVDELRDDLVLCSFVLTFVYSLVFVAEKTVEEKEMTSQRAAILEATVRTQQMQMATLQQTLDAMRDEQQRALQSREGDTSELAHLRKQIDDKVAELTQAKRENAQLQGELTALRQWQEERSRDQSAVRCAGGGADAVAQSQCKQFVEARDAELSQALL